MYEYEEFYTEEVRPFIVNNTMFSWVLNPTGEQLTASLTADNTTITADSTVVTADAF